LAARIVSSGSATISALSLSNSCDTALGCWGSPRRCALLLL
jgi:hypothetical protein